MERFILEAALEGLEQQKLCINAQIEKVNYLLSGKEIGVLDMGHYPEAPKRTMSAAGRARVAAAQRKRWAKIHRQQKRAK